MHKDTYSFPKIRLEMDVCRRKLEHQMSQIWQRLLEGGLIMWASVLQRPDVNKESNIVQLKGVKDDQRRHQKKTLKKLYSKWVYWNFGFW